MLNLVLRWLVSLVNRWGLVLKGFVWMRLWRVLNIKGSLSLRLIDLVGKEIMSFFLI